MHVLSRQRGVTLIEVLMAVLIFSIGLIGLAGLLVVATHSNQEAYLRTQVAFLAHNMADRMNANPLGVWAGDYNTTYPSIAAQTCNLSTGCSPSALANYDQQMWSSQLKTFLPNPSATIACTNPATGFVPSTSQLDMRPPYGGNCVMTITWNERQSGAGVGPTTDTSSNQQFTWNFQP
ncbi:MAG: type IV pilus modification protein PilV [Rhodanobacter sp.]